MSMSIQAFVLGSLSDDELVERITSSDKEATRKQADFLICLGEFDRRQLSRSSGAKDTVKWVARKFDISQTTAYNYVKVSKTLHQFKYVWDAFQEGEINYSKVRLIAPYLTEENELELVSMAQKYSYAELKRALAGRDGPGKDEAEKENTFRVWTDQTTGRVHVSANLDPVTGQKLITALKIGELANYACLSELDESVFDDEDLLDEAIEQASSEPEIEEAEQIEKPEPTLSLESLASSRFGRPMGAKLMASFMAMLNMVHSMPTNARRAPGATVHLTMSEDGHVHMPANPSAPARMLTPFLLNSHMRGQLFDVRGVTLNYGRKRRLISDSQANAILSAWGFQCATPGCTHTQFLEFHHIQEWERGGLTNMDNLVVLCSNCHALVSQRIISIRPYVEDGHMLEFCFNDGSRYVSKNRGIPERADDRASDLHAIPPELPLVVDTRNGEAEVISFDVS